MIRLYRALLHLYPASFRMEYGDEMTALFAQAWERATATGRIGLLLTTVADETLSAVAVHWAILGQDLRYTARTLTRARGFALTAILVTALGVGANTAAFSVADFVLLRPLPFVEPDALVRLCEGPRTGAGWGCMNELSPANYRDFKTMSSSFEAMGAFNDEAVNLVGAGEPRRLDIAVVTPEVLPLLGVKPALGRVFGPGDVDRDAVVISHGLWQSQFGGDPAVLGRTVNLNGAAYTIIGLMPPGFYFPTRDIELWAPLTFREEDFANRNNTYIEGVARLKAGVTFEQARAELESLADRLARDYPQTNEETGISFFRMRDNMSPRFRLMLMALGGATLCLLLLTCANLANLLLARAAARDRELAVRAALGAGKERLVRQLVTESVTLTALGGLAGVAVAASSVPLFSSLVPSTLPVASQPGLDLRVLALASLFTALTGLGFGLFPALRAARLTEFAALREGHRAGGGRRQRVRAVLVTVEVTMSVILLITSALLIRAIWRVQTVDPGFSPRNVLTLRTALPRPKYDSPVRRNEFYQSVLTQVRALPGVHSAAFTSGLPMITTGLVTGVEIPGQEVRSARSSPVSHRWVTPQYFGTMGIPLHRGRDVEDGDTGDRAWVAVVSASFVERYWPGQDAIGRTFRHRGRTRTVVGVVGDIRVRGLERTSEPQIYLPAPQAADVSPGAFDPKELVIRHSGRPDPLAAAVRQIVRRVDPEQPISNVRRMDDVVAGETATRRGQLYVLGLLTAIAVVLAGVGIYGLLAFTVSQRSQEIGVRLALGADPSRVGRMIVGDGLRLALLGIVPGVLGGYAAARGMSALLFGIAPGDPAAFGTAVALALLMTFAGSLVPAFRAVRIAPMSALRAE
ncbi:MAG TPA: ABC transporter permease [Vicinamibacterales bacterium]|nr:ABC transporter permease [Vicinamibacterales bacterium]